MTDEQIVEAAKSAGEKTEFGKLVHSKVSRGVNSAYGIGFLEGAEWAREQMMKEAVEGEVMGYIGGDYGMYISVDLPPEIKIDKGDYVKLIIVKEDKK